LPPSWRLFYNSIVKTAKWVSTAGVIAAAVAFTPTWEGMDSVAKRDSIGTGHPITYCNGLTSHDGTVKVGQRFTKKECDERLAEALPKYLAEIEPCVHTTLPDKTAASLLDASFNAGPGAVCRSPMLAKMNAGNLRAGCDAFEGWYVRSDGQKRTGLVDRRDGEEHGDKRKSERALCLEGVNEGTTSKDGAIAHAAKIINARAPHTESVAAELLPAPVMDYPGSSDNATPRAGCGQDGLHCAVTKEAKPKTVVHRHHMLKPKAPAALAPACVPYHSFLWNVDCK
jgi:lysozyme